MITICCTVGPKWVDDAFCILNSDGCKLGSHKYQQLSVAYRLFCGFKYIDMLLKTLRLVLTCDNRLTRHVKHSGISCLHIKSQNNSDKDVFLASYLRLLNVWGKKSVVAQRICHHMKQWARSHYSDFGVQRSEKWRCFFLMAPNLRAYKE